MESKVKEFEQALGDVRKAHRLIYAYQHRMLDLVYFIKTKLDFPSFLAEKRFSRDIRKKRDGYLEVFNDMWAWDFLYSYNFEYYLGEIELEDKSLCALSVIQYSDTGYFDTETSSRTDINSFADEEESSTKLLFLLEVVPKGKKWIWGANEIVMDKQYARAKHQKTCLKHDKGNMQVIYSFPLSRFLNMFTDV